MKDTFQTFGPPELCTWRYGPGTCRFQTTEPQFARKLAKRSKARLVGWSVTNRYLRIFQEEIEPWRARDLVERYLRTANEAISGGTIPPNECKAADKVISAEKRGISTFRVYGKKTLKNRTRRSTVAGPPTCARK